jgi:hypothetical protein
MIISFNKLADYIKTGREIEFAFRNKDYSITYHSRIWYLYCDTDHKTIKSICFSEGKDIIVSKIANTLIDDKTVAQIFDELLYDPSSLYIL